MFVIVHLLKKTLPFNAKTGTIHARIQYVALQNDLIYAVHLCWAMGIFNTYAVELLSYFSIIICLML